MSLKMVLSFVALLSLAGAAHAAMPAAPLTGGQSVVPVAGGCGPGGYRGPYGGCRYYRAPGYGPPPGYYAPPPPRPYYAPRCFRGYYGQWVCR